MNRFAKPLVVCSLIATGAITLTGCHSAPQTAEKVMKTLQTEVYYLDRSMLPPNSELTVTLEDVSKMDVASRVISTKIMTLNTAPPYQVTLDYDSDLIKENMRYNVRAQIHKDGKLLYTSTQSNNPFSTSDAAVNIKVSKVAAPTKPNVSLTNTYWKVMTLNGEKVNTPEGARELFVQLKADGSVKGFAGCNNFMGNFIAKEYGLRFNGMASTMMMCQGRANALDSSLHHILRDTFEYKIKGETLTLFNESKEKIAFLNAVYFN